MTPTPGCLADRGDLAFLKTNWPKTLPGGAIHADPFPITPSSSMQAHRRHRLLFACTDFWPDIAVCLNAWAFERRSG
jgi:hypothetical protein